MNIEDKIAAIQAYVGTIPETPPEPIAKRERPLNKTSMSYWFPRIEAAGLPVPKTKFVEMTNTCRRIFWDTFDGEKIDFTDEPFFVDLRTVCLQMGYPCFLRTDHTSNKHEWKNTCFVDNPGKLEKHAMNIAYFSECVGAGPWDVYAVRELLPTIPYGTCPRYDDFPVCKEFRFFVNEGKVTCFHPYWPLESLEQGEWEVDADISTAYADLCAIEGGTFEHLKSLAERAGTALGGSWSIDFLETERGWFLTDMAESHKSFHWEGCAHNGS